MESDLLNGTESISRIAFWSYESDPMKDAEIFTALESHLLNGAELFILRMAPFKTCRNTYVVDKAVGMEAEVACCVFAGQTLFIHYWSTYLTAFARVKIKNLFVKRHTFIWPEFFVKISCVFNFLLHDMMQNQRKISFWNITYGLKGQHSGQTFFIHYWSTYLSHTLFVGAK